MKRQGGGERMSWEAVDRQQDRLQWRGIWTCGAVRSGAVARRLAGALILIAAAAHGGLALAHASLLEVRGATPEGRAAALQEALLATARLRQLRPHEGVTIRLHGGEYRLASPLLITPELSGTPGAPTIILAAPGEHPRLSGARAVQPACRPLGRCACADTRQGCKRGLAVRTGDREQPPLLAARALQVCGEHPRGTRRTARVVLRHAGPGALLLSGPRPRAGVGHLRGQPPRDPDRSAR